MTESPHKISDLKAAFARCQDLKQEHPDLFLIRARKLAERICKQLCAEQGIDLGTQPKLDTAIGKLNKNGAIPPHIHAALRSIQSYGNLGAHDQGSHNKHIDAELILPCVYALDTLERWYLGETQDKERPYGATATPPRGRSYIGAGASLVMLVLIGLYAASHHLKEETSRKVLGNFALVEAGEFMMGSSSDALPCDGHDETPHKVTISRDFWIQKTEVTQHQWQELMGNNPSRFDECGEQCPVERVNWFEALVYLNKMSDREGLEQCYELEGCSGIPGLGCNPSENQGYRCTGYACTKAVFKGLDCEGYRLPTEAEWEYAARAGSRASRYGDLDAIAWHKGNSGGETHPVATHNHPNAWGIHDMLGNVWEWTGDRSGETRRATYPAQPTRDPTGPTAGIRRMARGGSWNHDARFNRFGCRTWGKPLAANQDLGFRAAKTKARVETKVASPQGEPTVLAKESNTRLREGWNMARHDNE